jgi:low temperature requirement protein LtrA
VTTIGGFLGVLALWWVYFDEQSAATLRGGRWGFVVAYGHLPLWLGATAYGVGVKLAIEHANEVAENPGVRWALAGGAAVLLTAIAAFHLASASREPRFLSFARLVCVAALLAIAAFGSGLKLPTLTILAVLVSGTALLIEAISVRQASGRVMAFAAAAIQPPEQPWRPGTSSAPD